MKALVAASNDWLARYAEEIHTVSGAGTAVTWQEHPLAFQAKGLALSGANWRPRDGRGTPASVDGAAWVTAAGTGDARLSGSAAATGRTAGLCDVSVILFPGCRLRN